MAERGYIANAIRQQLQPSNSAALRTILVVPMLKDNELIGVVSPVPPRSSPFHRQADRAWSQNFAAQAVIAIENARLLNELRERTEQVEAQSRSWSNSTNNSNSASPTK